MFKRAFALTCAVAMAGGVGLAQQRPGGPATPPSGVLPGQVLPERVQPAERVQRTERAEEGALERAGQGRFARASELINSTVRSSDGQMIGKIQDLVVDTRANRIEYVILEGQASAEGFVVLPFALVEYQPVVTGPATAAPAASTAVVVDITPDRLRAAPTISASDWRTARTYTWATKVDTFFEDDLRQRRPPRRFDPNRPRPDELERDADDVRERIEEGAEERREDLEDRAEDARERARELRDNARDRADDIRDRVEDNLEESDERLEEARERRPDTRSLDTIEEQEDDID